MPGIRELRKILVRGARVRVRDTPKKSALHEARVFVKSEGLVPCRGDGRCAVDRKCNGHAVFVCKEDPATLPGGAGWRKGASKLCLTHLDDCDGNSLTRVRKSKVTKTEITAPEPEEYDSIRPNLLAENRRLKQRLIDLQEKLINVQSLALSEITEALKAEKAESFSAFGDHGIYDPEDSYTSDTRDHPFI